jgi:hypothetical protein
VADDGQINGAAYAGAPEPVQIRLTVNLRPSAVAALAKLCADGDNKSDAVNRALSLAAVVRLLAVDGVLTVVRDDGSHAFIYFV